MKCPHCGGQMGIEDRFCTHCGAPNALAARHQSEIDRFSREYDMTQKEVLKKAGFFRAYGGWLTVLVIILALLLASVIVFARSWDIGYALRSREGARHAASDQAILDEMLENGEYGEFYGYYNANIVYGSDETLGNYYGVYRAAGEYARIIEGISTLREAQLFPSNNEMHDYEWESLARSLIEVFTVEDQLVYGAEEYFAEDKLVHIREIQDRVAHLAEAYLGLSEEDIARVPDMSEKRLTNLLEERAGS